MDEFLRPLLGGLLIGFSSSLMLGGLGRIAGISGMIEGSLSRPTIDQIPSYFFLIGLLLGPLVVSWFVPELLDYSLDPVNIRTAVAGVLVGIGTRMAGGCTSGHGVCGLGRMSKRSLVATLTFLLFGMITVFMEGLF